MTRHTLMKRQVKQESPGKGSTTASLPKEADEQRKSNKSKETTKEKSARDTCMKANKGNKVSFPTDAKMCEKNLAKAEIRRLLRSSLSHKETRVMDRYNGYA